MDRSINTSSSSKVFFRTAVLKIEDVSKFIGKHLRWSLLVGLGLYYKFTTKLISLQNVYL